MKINRLATKDIMELAQSTSNLSTFVTAVNAAGLTSALKGPGPFTVFAPSNAAFANVDAGYIGSSACRSCSTGRFA